MSGSHGQPPTPDHDNPAAGVEPMPEVPGGPQLDVPAAQGHMPPEHDADAERDPDDPPNGDR